MSAIGAWLPNGQCLEQVQIRKLAVRLDAPTAVIGLAPQLPIQRFEVWGTQLALESDLLSDVRRVSPWVVRCSLGAVRDCLIVACAGPARCRRAFLFRLNDGVRTADTRTLSRRVLNHARGNSQHSAYGPGG